MIENLNFAVKGNNYSIKFPNIGEFKTIEVMKQALSNGVYDGLIKTNTSSAQYASEMIEMEAFLSVLCPKLIEELYGNISFRNLGIKDYLELAKAYKSQVSPWWDEILKMVSGQED